MPQTWAQFIRSIRNQFGLSRAEFAEEIGVTQAAIYQWERGGGPRQDNQRRVEDWLSKQEGETAVSSFGMWLREQRTKADLSVPQLAQLSQVTPPTIYNIENGRIQNPQDSTITKLSNTLKINAPSQVLEETEKNQAIEGLGSLIDFDPYAQDEWPTYAGIYVFYDKNGRMIYIGKGANIANRLKDHNDKFWFKKPIVVYASYVRVDEEKLRHQLEQVMIKFVKRNVLINIQSTESFRDD